jgi:hypothetical protein
MGKFMSLHFNGRARIALATAVLVPPVLIPISIMFGVKLEDFDVALLLWSFLVVVAVTAAYCVFAVAKLLSWMARGITEEERHSYSLVGEWTFGAIVILMASTGLALHRYEIIPLGANSRAAYLKYDRWTGHLEREVPPNEASKEVSTRKQLIANDLEVLEEGNRYGRADYRGG